jgi:CBS domain-containing protein
MLLRYTPGSAAEGNAATGRLSREVFNGSRGDRALREHRGRRRQMKLESIYRPGVFAVDSDHNLAAAACRMEEAQVGTLAVLDGGELVGIITERDLIRAIAQVVNPAYATVSAYASPGPHVADVEEDSRDVVRRMLGLGARDLPVTIGDGPLRDRQVVGMISMRDLLMAKALVE